MNKLKFLTIFLTIALTTIAFKCGGSKPPATNDGIYRGRLYTDSSAKTPEGASVFAQGAINVELLPLIDAGLNRLNQIASAAPNNYTNLAPPSAYNVYLYPRSPRCENPAFLIESQSSPEYDNSEWDKDPTPGKVTICVAGLVVGTNDYSMLVVDDVSIMSQIVRYEGEHLELFHVDRERYEATKFHTATNYHPILGEGVQTNVRSWSQEKNPRPLYRR